MINPLFSITVNGMETRFPPHVVSYWNYVLRYAVADDEINPLGPSDAQIRL